MEKVRVEETDQMLTVEEIQYIMKFGKNKTYELVRSVGFPSIKIGRDYRIPKKEFERWKNSYTGKEYML